MSEGGFTEIPGYGRRDPAAEIPALHRWQRGRLRARVELVAAFLVFGAVFPLQWVMGVQSGEDAPTPFVGVLLVAASAACLAPGAWLAIRSVVSWDEHGLEFRHRPWRKPVRVAPGDVVWRPGATYVGRFLAARAVDGAPVSFPLWLLRRSSARRLFTYLDAVAARPAT